MDEIIEEKKISAIITTCNRVEYLKKAIDSIKNQTYKNIEIIVVDDGSTDKTREICEQDSSIKYIFIPKEEHKNGNYARNLGINNSIGEFVAFLDDDDEWMKDKIQKQMEKILDDEKIGMVYTGLKVEVNNGEYYYENKVNKENRGNCSKKSLYAILSVTSTMLFRKESLIDIGLFDENVKFWQETELIMRIAQRYLIDYVDESLVLYRQNLKGKKQMTNNIEGFLQAIEYINKKHEKEINELSKEERNLRKKLIYLDIANRYSNLNKNIDSRKYLLKVFKLYPSIKNFIKLVFNITVITKLRFIVFFNKLGKGKNEKFHKEDIIS